MLGGSAFSQLGIIINNPAAITRIIGTALPASSNFFINYVIIQVAPALARQSPAVLSEASSGYHHGTAHQHLVPIAC